MSTWNSVIPYFTESELACKSTGISKLNKDFAVMLPVP